MQLTLIAKTVYGRALYYPTCEAGRQLAEFAGLKVLSKKHLPILKRMGFELDIQSDPSLAQ